MRMRKKKHADERINACSDIIFKLENDSLPEDEFLSNARIHLEIGCGKGAFICETAKRNPDINFIAVEKIPNVAVTALERAKAEEIPNIRFMIGDASGICEKLKEHSIERLYLNFSDPWPKKGYAKRRLTHRGFLEKYKRILKADGAIFFKTDNRPLFDFSLEELAESGFRLEAVTNDLHASEYAENNVMTEYEKNFSSQGIPINRVEAYLD
ncbi:MAG: tRNA (guanosine(46)-N7)-methyltransferase TrmB [Clostridia bacterium]|nr:tRNA (guanosine(46)-N7)-methyltransferase TrmB [Clostridia bacterium]